MSGQAFEVKVGQEGYTTVVSLSGPVDSASLETFKSRLDPICCAPGARVLLDCKGLTYLNSSSIGMLMKYHRALMVSRGKLVLCELNTKLVRTFDLLHVGKALALYPNREEALKALG